MTSKFRVMNQFEGFYPNRFRYIEAMRLSPKAVLVFEINVARRMINRLPTAHSIFTAAVSPSQAE